MENRLAILCPGQGGQHARLFDFAAANPGTKALLDALPLEPLLGMPVSAALADGGPLFENRIAQPLIVASAAMTWHAVRDLLPAPSLVAGYSIGELSAYVVAGSIQPAEAVTLAARRACFMDACAGGPVRQRLMAVSGIGTERLAGLLQPYKLYMAIETGEDSAIVGGEREDAEAIGETLRAMGCRISVLPVDVASHTPCMGEAVARFLDELHQHRFGAPSCPVLSGISGRLVFHAEEAQTALARQIAETIRWKDCMDACAEAGITIALELGPGSALSRMLRERHPHIECRSVDEFRTADGVARWVGRHFD